MDRKIPPQIINIDANAKSPKRTPKVAFSGCCRGRAEFLTLASIFLNSCQVLIVKYYSSAVKFLIRRLASWIRWFCHWFNSSILPINWSNAGTSRRPKDTLCCLFFFNRFLTPFFIDFVAAMIFPHWSVYKLLVAIFCLTWPLSCHSITLLRINIYI